MVFNWFKKDATDPGQKLKKMICGEMQEASDEYKGGSRFLRLLSRSLRSEIADTMIRNTSARDPDIEKRLQGIKDQIGSAKKIASGVGHNPSDVNGAFGEALGITKTIRNVSQDISRLGSRTEGRLYADCPNNRVFIDNLKRKFSDGAEKMCLMLNPELRHNASGTVIEVNLMEVNEQFTSIAFKRLIGKHIHKKIDRYRRVFSSPNFFLSIPADLKTEFKSIDQQQVKVPQRTVAPLPKHEKANEFEMKKIEEAMRRITESETGMLREIAELKGMDCSGMARKERLARDQRLAALEGAMKEKEDQLKKTDERLERMRWKNDHIDEENIKINKQNADAIERFCAELEKDLQQLVSAYEEKREALDGLLAQLAVKVKESRHKVMSLAKVRETLKESYERAKARPDGTKPVRLKMFMEAKTVKELEAAYESMEGERIARFGQAMVLKMTLKAGGIEEMIGYSVDDALVDVLKARSRGIPRKAIEKYMMDDLPPRPT